GDDTLDGGGGDDVFFIDADDTVFEAEGEGHDTVVAAASYTLGDNLEDLTLTVAPAAVNGTGNALSNFIRGNALANALAGGAGDDSLMGGAGADRLDGGAGSDLYWVDNAGDVVVEAGTGFDRVLASVDHAL